MRNVTQLKRVPLLFAAIAAIAAAPSEWRYYGGDAGGTKYSPLDQINKKNVRQLKPVWIFDTGDFSDGKLLSRTLGF